MSTGKIEFPVNPKSGEEIPEQETADTMLCKIGTHAAKSVFVDRRRKIMRKGGKLRVREIQAYSMWYFVRIDRINANGFFFASKI